MMIFWENCPSPKWRQSWEVKFMAYNSKTRAHKQLRKFIAKSIWMYKGNNNHLPNYGDKSFKYIQHWVIAWIVEHLQHKWASSSCEILHCLDLIQNEFVTLDYINFLLIWWIADHNLLDGRSTTRDFFSTARDRFLTSSFGMCRGRLSQSPPSTIMVVPLTYLPSQESRDMRT